MDMHVYGGKKLVKQKYWNYISYYKVYENKACYLNVKTESWYRLCKKKKFLKLR